MSQYHKTAIVEPNAVVGKNVTLGCFVQICDEGVVGDQSVIKGLTIVSSNVSIGDRAQIGIGTIFIASGNFTDRIYIGHDSTIGAGCIVHNGISIGHHAVITSGTIIKRSVPSMAIVEGSPARIVGYVGANFAEQNEAKVTTDLQKVRSTSVRGVTLHNMLQVPDIRGSLTVGEFDRDIPFPVKR